MLADIGLASVALAAIALASYFGIVAIGAKSAERDALVREATQIGNQKVAAMQVAAANDSVAQMKTALDALNQKFSILAKGSSDADVVAPGDGDDSLRKRGASGSAAGSAAVPGGDPAGPAGSHGVG